MREWGVHYDADTNSGSYAAFRPRRLTTYEWDANSSGAARHRRYNCYYSRFDQPDPSHGSYDPAGPQQEISDMLLAAKPTS